MPMVAVRRLASILVLASLSLSCERAPCSGVVCGASELCNPTDGECHCGELDGPVCGAAATCLAASLSCLPDPARCGSGTRWFPGAMAFEEVTDAWGLRGVEGTRLTVTDIDGDGWADLEVRRGAAEVEAQDGPRRVWLLRNTGAGFEDVTASSGFLTRRQPGGGGRPVDVVAWGDVDNDGDLDAFSAIPTSDPERSGGETTEILLNDGTGRFTLGPAGSPIRRTDSVDAPAAASFVDVDHDGVLDLWVPQAAYTGTLGQLYLQNDRLWRGDGSGRFDDVTAERGLLTTGWDSMDDIDAARAHTQGWAGAACDLNGDGWAELLAASYGRAPNHLWLARAGGLGFDNRSVASGYAFDQNLTWEDNENARCFCQANRAAEGCGTLPAPRIACTEGGWVHERDRRPFRLGGVSAATFCGDLDNDGDIDLLTSEIRHWWAGSGADAGEVLLNDGSGTFTRPGRDAMGLAIDHRTVAWDEGHLSGAIFDFDNDGWLDVYIGGTDYPRNRGRLYRNQAGAVLGFTEVFPSAGLDHNRSHGIAIADFDRDGDLDVIVGHSRARCAPSEPNDCYETSQIRFFRNVAGDGGNFVQLRLEGGPGTNRAAIGARARVTTPDGVVQTREVDGGHGHFGAQEDLVLHFGLGAHCEAEVEIRWPDAALSTQRFRVTSGHRFHVVQGRSPALAP
ncbi:MAG: CRTAC1 family protein [Sandaracinaceae bacterium]|nr:CRTAC1 family protein [Sandaracinaceae bacterium]